MILEILIAISILVGGFNTFLLLRGSTMEAELAKDNNLKKLQITNDMLGEKLYSSAPMITGPPLHQVAEDDSDDKKPIGYAGHRG